MVARQSKFTTIVNLVLGVIWLILGISNLFVSSGTLLVGILYLVVAVAYLLIFVYNWRNGFFRIENGQIIKCEFLAMSKRIKLDEINWAKCIGSYYTLKSPTKKMTIELASVHKDDIPGFEKLLKDIVMSVPPYKKD
ncbi:MAG: hypothetical protein MI866_20485 [Bacteroidales bacterium]|nr:hypothetical protein [Bacteroidales bacterium]